MRFIPRKFNIEYSANFNSIQNNHNLKIWMVKPQSSVYQKLEEFKVSERPSSCYEERNANKILYFDFKKINNLNFKIKMKVVLKNNELEFDKKITNATKNVRQLKNYVKSEKFLEQTDKIKKLTEKITQKEKFIPDKIIAITKFLKSNFEYVYPIKKRGVKNLNLKNLKGDCGEVGALFVTMCRTLGIPAINNTGYIIYFDELNNIYEHGRTSIYLNEIGWLQIDPLAENIKKSKSKYIYEQKNYLLTLTCGFNVKLSPQIPEGYNIKYWNKLGLPLTQNSVQVLQPIVFSSEKKIEFKDSIRLI